MFDYSTLLKRVARLLGGSSIVHADEVELLEAADLFIQGTPARLSLDRRRLKVDGQLSAGPAGAFLRVGLGRGARVSVKPVTSTKDEPGQPPVHRIRISAPDPAGIQANVGRSKILRLGRLMEMHVVGRHMLTFASPTRIRASARVGGFHANAEQAPAQARRR